jgi:hypothetical protein
MLVFDHIAHALVPLGLSLLLLLLLYRTVGVPRGTLHVTFCPSRGQNPRRDALCLSAAPAPRPGRTNCVIPSRPKRAAISRLFAENVKCNFGRLENREITGVLERGVARY